MTKKFDLWHDFDRLMPPGMTFNRIWGSFLTILLLMFCIWWAAAFSLMAEIGNFKTNLARGFYQNGSVPYMSTINELLHFFVVFSLFAAVFLLCYTIPNYLYFRKDSKSVYLMKRIRSPMEIHKLCWTVPSISAAAVMLLMGVAYGVFSLIYLYTVPALCLPEQTIAFFWRCVP